MWQGLLNLKEATMKKVPFLAVSYLLLLFFPLLFVEGPQEANAEYRVVKQVVDGDTLILENGERVRLIGVDTPETKHPQKPVQYLGHEATTFTRNMVEGKRVWVEYDQANAHVGHRDKYGRTLAYVFREDGKFVNGEIISEGYGHAYTQYPFKYLNEFRALERQAREQKRGLWNADGNSTDVPRSASRNAIPNSKAKDGTPLGYTPTGKPIYEGPRGGHYHWSENGTKVYHPRPSSVGNGTIIGTTPAGKTLYEGPRGGVYHYSESGNKVYHSGRGTSGRGRR
jgi:micrococcal nuclease